MTFTSKSYIPYGRGNGVYMRQRPLRANCRNCQAPLPEMSPPNTKYCRKSECLKAARQKREAKHKK